MIGSARKIGGIAGLSTQGSINNCVNHANISGEKYAGGICGYSQSTWIDSCGNEVDTVIESTYGYAGGIVRICRKSTGYRICSRNVL